MLGLLVAHAHANPAAGCHQYGVLLFSLCPVLSAINRPCVCVCGRARVRPAASSALTAAATSKGKYVALAVLLPRVGAVRALELCPSLVEQLVWAVGVRGNVSGQAVSLLLQLLKAIAAEVRVESRVNTDQCVVVRMNDMSQNMYVGSRLVQVDFKLRKHQYVGTRYSAAHYFPDDVCEPDPEIFARLF